MARHAATLLLESSTLVSVSRVSLRSRDIDVRLEVLANDHSGYRFKNTGHSSPLRDASDGIGNDPLSDTHH